MKIRSFLFVSTLAAMPVLADEIRHLDAHEHGVGQLNIAYEGQQIAIDLRAPGADIVGFEYAAESAEDRAVVDAAVAILARPLDLFVMPAGAKCSVVQASAALKSQDAHGENHAKHDHDHAKHDHADKEHAGHDGHGDEAHVDHEGHNDHAKRAGHTEFHAEYLLDCADPAAASSITFAYFETFPNALELEVQVISDTGSTAFEVARETPILDLRGMF